MPLNCQSAQRCALWSFSIPLYLGGTPVPFFANCTFWMMNFLCCTLSLWIHFHCTWSKAFHFLQLKTIHFEVEKFWISTCTFVRWVAWACNCRNAIGCEWQGVEKDKRRSPWASASFPSARPAHSRHQTCQAAP